MNLNRREFVILAGACAAGCAVSGENEPPRLREVSIDAGPVSDYSADGVYDRYRSQGFFIVRQGEQLFAISSICTHRACKLKSEPDQTLHCKCHGSTFTSAGIVTTGPATRNLPRLPSAVQDGRLWIKAVAAVTALHHGGETGELL